MAKKKDFTGDPGGLIGDAMFSVIKPIYKEGEKVKRQQRRRPKRTYYKPEPKVTQKEIVFSVMRRAIRNAGANFSARDLYYAVRPLAYAHREWDEDAELKYKYFSQNLLTEYQEWEGTIAGLWRDPRGHLHEPHSEVCEVCGVSRRGTLALGTREVATYQFPEHAFNKILYVEKEGEWTKFEAAKLGERYDMAVALGKGYPVEAVRELFSKAEGGNYQLFVFHDADIDGYEIARVMREATRRMPHHNVDVVDIGLTIGDAVEMDLDDEPYFRKGGVPRTLSRRLTDLEREYFSGQRGRRFELNAILPDTRRIEYIEEKLEEHGAAEKVIPPGEELPGLAEDIYRDEASKWVDVALEEILGWDAIKVELADEFMEAFKLENSERYIRARFKKDDALSWRSALDSVLADIHNAKHTDALKDAVKEKVVEALAEVEEGEEDG